MDFQKLFSAWAHSYLNKEARGRLETLLRQPSDWLVRTLGQGLIIAAQQETIENLRAELAEARRRRQGRDDLWMEFMGPASQPAHCGLCGNSGWIDTRGHVSTGAGLPCGVQAPCICPNGRVTRDRESVHVVISN